LAKYINRDSFEINGAVSDTGTVYGTVEVTLGNQTKRVRATMWVGGDIYAYGVTGRYMTGKKAWPGYVSSRPGWNNDHVSFGFDSHSGKHRKVAIHFAVEA
jgi:hypothetical protein